MFRPAEVRALPGYRLWVQYADGVEGTIDLSYLVGKGVFAAWNDYHVFEKVHIGDGGEIAWCHDIDLCPDSIYFKVSGKSPEQVFPNLHETNA